MRYISTRVNELKAGDIWTLCVPGVLNVGAMKMKLLSAGNFALMSNNDRIIL